MSCILCAGKIEAGFLFTVTLILPYLSQKRGAAQSSTSVHNSADTETVNASF